MFLLSILFKQQLERNLSLIEVLESRRQEQDNLFQNVCCGGLCAHTTVYNSLNVLKKLLYP